uniref:Uncharacterized protein n=1 Tax=Romanomermis culicivorax TaxID=13658 RepID=A0A915HYY5_ROMCU
MTLGGTSGRSQTVDIDNGVVVVLGLIVMELLAEVDFGGSVVVAIVECPTAAIKSGKLKE